MNSKTTKTRTILLGLWVIYWGIIFILPKFNLILRGSLYSILVMSLTFMVITLKMIRESNLEKWGNIWQLIIGILIFPSIFLSFSLLIILGGMTSYHPCFREYPSPSHKLVLTMESCGSLTVGYNYTLSRKYGIFEKVKSRGRVSPNISGKWYSHRFESLKIEWNSQETQIRWELKDYSTTGSSEDNSLMPIRGIINN